MPERNIKLTIAYDGTAYHGWQRQQNTPATLQQTLEEALAAALHQPDVCLRGSGRTDAGVHAAGQVANFFTSTPIPDEKIARVANGHLPPDIRLLTSARVPDDFDAVTSARSKLYRYTVCCTRSIPLELRNRVYPWFHPCDLTALRHAADRLIGEHDFASFASLDKNNPDKSTVRTLYRCHGFRTFDLLYFDLEGSGFLYHMVRNIVGSLLQVARGHWPPEQIDAVLAARDRTAAGPMAPAAGLCLQWVQYQ